MRGKSAQAEQESLEFNEEEGERSYYFFRKRMREELKTE